MKIKPCLKTFKFFIRSKIIQNNKHYFAEADIPSNLIDCHVHSTASPDGFLTISEIISQAKENNLSHVAITDHNTCVGIDSYMRALGAQNNEIYIEQDGVKLICGAEITCYYHHSRKFSQKLHILCYGFDRNPDNDFMQLLKAKLEDYEETFFSIPNTLTFYYDIYKDIYNKEDFKNFIFNERLLHNKNTHDPYSSDEVVKYFVSKGLDEKIVRDDIVSLASLYKQKDNIIIKVETVIDLVHKAGGKCMVAHPLKSYRKFMKKHHFRESDEWAYITSMTNQLLALGVDGIELISVANPKSVIRQRFNDLYKNVGFTAYGSDRHDNTTHSMTMGFIQGYTPPCNFIEVIEDLQAKQLSPALAERQKKRQAKISKSHLNEQTY